MFLTQRRKGQSVVTLREAPLQNVVAVPELPALINPLSAISLLTNPNPTTPILWFVLRVGLTV
jgi:hypothetical protein